MSVSIIRGDGAVVVTMAWTHTRNALGPDEAVELATALDEAGRTAGDVGALVLTGSGAFCSGGDLRTFAELGATCSAEEMSSVVYRKIHGVVQALRDCPLPTVAAVDGAAIGLGFDLALACDLRYIGPRGWMQQGWSRVGLIAAGGGWHFLAARSSLLPWGLLLTQARLGPQECARHGLAVAATASAIASATEAARQLALLPPRTRAGYVHLHRRATWPSDDYLRECAWTQAELLRSPEFRDRAQEMLAARADQGRAGAASGGQPTSCPRPSRRRPRIAASSGRDRTGTDTT